MFEELCNRPSDINEHLKTLRDLASECDHITEMGTRYIVSTWAFVEGIKEGGTVIAIDYKHPREYNASLAQIEDFCAKKGVNFTFKEENTLENEIGLTDLLFIDTDHTYNQLKAELKRHAHAVRLYLVFHDTESCRDELMPAINELIAEGRWVIKKQYTNNNGLLVLQNRIPYSLC